MRVGAIVQARMGSRRLPGKVLFQAAGKSLLEHLIERLLHSKTLNLIIVATSRELQDDAIVALCHERGYSIFRGSECDVLDRYYQAARHFRLSTIVRVTADCPLIDPDLVDELVEYFLSHEGEYELVTNRHPLTFPDGLDADVFSMAALTEAWKNAQTAYQREHTIPYFWEAGRRVFNFQHPDNLFLRYRWTLDYPEDYVLIRQIYEHLYRPGHVFGLNDILHLLSQHPELSQINAKYLPPSTNCGRKQSIFDKV